MKNLLRFFLILLIISFTFQNYLNSQVTQPVSATGHIMAEIIPVFSATETSQMNFGRFAPGPEGGEIILTPESTVSVLGSVYAGAGTCNAASFYVSGDNDVAFSITLPAGPITLTHTSSPRTMHVTDWISNPPAGAGTGMLYDGFQVVYVGATLMVGSLADNPVGIYTGTYDITFDFN